MLPVVKPLKTFDFAYTPAIDKKQVLSLASRQFIWHVDNVLVLRPAGMGKTRLAVSQGINVVEAGYWVLITTTAHLIAALTNTHSERQRSQRPGLRSRGGARR